MPTPTTAFRLTPDDLAQLDELKAKGFRTRTAALRWAVAHALMSYQGALDDDAHLIALSTKPKGPLATKWEPKAQLLQDIQGTAVALPQPDGQLIQQASRTIKLVSAHGVAPPLKAGQAIKAEVNGALVTVDLANCCRMSKGTGAAHTKGCILKALGYVD